MSGRKPPILTWAGAVARARFLSGTGGRVLLGITGPPGAGKSSLAAELQRSLGGRCAVVPMDGFHLSNAELARRQLRASKGSPRTFDAEGFAAALSRIRDGHRDVLVPDFDRTIDEPVSAAISVPADVPLVIVEGNYLLLPDSPWPMVHRMLTETWYCTLPDAIRAQRLMRRHMSYGWSARHAAQWVSSVDDANARAVERTRDRAELWVEVPRS